jgi:hypothetical protein
MNGSNPEIMIEVRVDHGNITETYDPFWFAHKFCEIQLINDPDAAISATGA